ncbi:hypothetical protein GW17_00021643, partial [Ensete ventricosum]
SREAEVEGKGEEELDHHIIDMTNEDVCEDEVGSGGDEDAKKSEEGSGDHCVPSIGPIDVHPLKVGPEAPKLVVNMGEATCVRHPISQQRLGATTGGLFHDDASSRH